MDTPPGLHNHSVAAAALRSAVEAIPHYQPSLRRPHKCQKRTTTGATEAYYMRTFERAREPAALCLASPHCSPRPPRFGSEGVVIQDEGLLVRLGLPFP